MSFLPNALTPDQFNRGIPDVVVNVESIGRILVIVLAVVFLVFHTIHAVIYHQQSL